MSQITILELHSRFFRELKELFTGGNYRVLDENCIGFSGYIENLVKESLIKVNDLKKIFVNEDINSDVKHNLQKKVISW